MDRTRRATTSTGIALTATGYKKGNMMRKITIWSFVVVSNSLISAANVVNFVEGGQDEILLESFAENDPIHTWTEMNDPVMGGRSTGSFAVNNGLGVFQGDVVEVPFLHAPGFIQARTTDRLPFPDVSRCSAIKIVLRTNGSNSPSTEKYAGYRVSFGTEHAPGGKFFAKGYKATFPRTWPLSEDKNDFAEIVLPFDQFTDFWDDATGDPIHTCQDNVLYCPNPSTLQNLKTISIWGEGVAGRVHLEIQSISAVGCAADTDATDQSLTAIRKPSSTMDDSRWLPRHLLRGWLRQLSLSTFLWTE